ncbi:hypothetical protein [Actinomadura rupiterrae]|uniref:hypothetical protein n=1 Tax=Actinomadura rupiterrae TaxID=559627 RepID=UPI0020A28B39|nr:hypothetical protein [Actinomadura rupiterrae]MCP2341340.1 hypothetical protein [Actinomadura rupiterrae]
MAVGTNVPVLVGPVPLLFVQSMTVTEGYEVERIAGSRFVQATQPTRKRIGIEALLAGPDRLALKKALEALALASRRLADSAARRPADVPGALLGGISVVSGLTVSLEMQITELHFTQSVNRRDALDVSIALEEVPRASLLAALGEVADLAVAAGSALLPGTVPSNPIARSVTGLL